MRFVLLGAHQQKKIEGPFSTHYSNYSGKKEDLPGNTRRAPLLRADVRNIDIIIRDMVRIHEGDLLRSFLREIRVDCKFMVKLIRLLDVLWHLMEEG